MSERIELTIFKSLIHNEDFARKVLPFLKEDYFQNRIEKVLYSEIEKFVRQYNNLPNKESLLIELSNRRDINEEEYKNIHTLLNSLPEENTDQTWLLNTTEKFCKDRAVHNAILNGIKILDGKDKQHSPEAIPSILTEALSVSFDKSVGHDYLEDSEKRFDWYHKKEDRIQFDLKYFNKITKGGIPNKTLNIILAGTGIGKSLFMCHLASSILSQGKNVLYITLEMAEERIAERIDANLLNVPISELYQMPKVMYNTKIKSLENRLNGKLIIKEYPTASAHSGHFRSLLDELALKKSFKPDIIFIDYLNICSSSRFKAGSNTNSYTIIKSIAEELRGLAVEFDLPIVSATQTTRTGFVSTDIGLEDTSESFGLPATADFMFALISSEELEQLGQIRVKQLKNRYNDPTMNKSFVIGVDRSKMRLYDVEDSAQTLVNTNLQSTKTEIKQIEEVKESSDPYDRFSDFN